MIAPSAGRTETTEGAVESTAKTPTCTVWPKLPAWSITVALRRTEVESILGVVQV